MRERKYCIPFLGEGWIKVGGCYPFLRRRGKLIIYPPRGGIRIRFFGVEGRVFEAGERKKVFFRGGKRGEELVSRLCYTSK